MTSTKPLAFLLADEQATISFGQQLAVALDETAIIFLHGELGAGKTTLVRGMLRAMGYNNAVKSPTYTLVEEYYIANKHIYHFDLYRLNNPEELDFMGIRDYFHQAIILIEWPEKGASYLPTPDLNCYIEIDENSRRITLEALSDLGQNILQKLVNLKR